MTKLLPILLVMLMMTVGSAMAINIVKPAPDTVGVCGTYNFSANIKTAGSVANVSFYWNNSGTMVPLCSSTNTTSATTFLNVSYSCTASTASITDGTALNIYALGKGSGAEVAEQNSSNVATVDNAGPVLTFAGDNVNDGRRIDDASSFKVSMTTNEMATGPYVTIGGVQFNLVDAGDGITWTKTFDANAIPQGAYTYSVNPGTDNTTCLNVGSAKSGKVNIQPQGSTASKAASAGAIGRGAEATATTTFLGNKNNQQALGLVAVAVVIYVLFFHNKKKGRK
jgi:hypothetical protein